MKTTQFTFSSSNGTDCIHAWLWEPDTPSRAVLQIAHGITEHMGRYREFARYFTDRGFAVIGHDHIGHGASMRREHPLPMYLGPAGSWRFVVEDIRRCAAWARERFPGVPHCLLGFSLGSFAVRCLLGDYPETADLTIWAGTGQMSAPEIWFASAIAKLEEQRFGDTKDTPLLHKLTMGTYNQHFQPCRTGSDWLCANPDAIDQYLADPLCGDGFTVSAFRELLSGMKRSRKPKHVSKMNKTMPILLLSGKEDPVGNFGKGVAAVQAQLDGLGFADVEVSLFEGMRHDVFREKDRAAVFQRIETWLNQHCQE